MQNADFVSYFFYGGEAGSGASTIRIEGNGRVQYTDHPGRGPERGKNRTKERRLPPAETQAVFEKLVKAGIFNLASGSSRAPDIGGARVEAQLGPRRVKAEITSDLISRRKNWRRIEEEIKTLFPLHGELSARPHVEDQEAIIMKYVMSSDVDIEVGHATIQLPLSLQLVDGPLSWAGPLKAGQPETFEFSVKPIRCDYHYVTTSFYADDLVEGFRDWENQGVYVSAKNRVSIGGKPPVNHWYGGVWRPENVHNQKIKSKLEFSGSPELSRELTITYQVTSHIDLPDPRRTQMSLVFPPEAFRILGVQYPPGGKFYKRFWKPRQMSWKGSVKKGESVRIQMRVQPKSFGWGDVSGHLNVSSDPQESINDVKGASLCLDEEGGKI